MTLQEWSKRYKYDIQKHAGGGTYVIVESVEDKAALYLLSDYAVSTVSGITVWLAPRKAEDFRFHDEVRPHVAGIARAMMYAGTREATEYCSSSGVYGALDQALRRLITVELGQNVVDAIQNWEFGATGDPLEDVEGAIQLALDRIKEYEEPEE